MFHCIGTMNWNAPLHIFTFQQITVCEIGVSFTGSSYNYFHPMRQIRPNIKILIFIKKSYIHWCITQLLAMADLYPSMVLVTSCPGTGTEGIQLWTLLVGPESPPDYCGTTCNYGPLVS